MNGQKDLAPDGFLFHLQHSFHTGSGSRASLAPLRTRLTRVFGEMSSNIQYN